MNKKFGYVMFPSFEVAAEPSGGGTATAPAPAPATPAPTAPAPANPAPAAPPAPTKSGYFQGLKRAPTTPEPTTTEPKTAAPAPVSGEKVQIKDDAGAVLAEFDTEAEARAFIKEQGLSEKPAEAPKAPETKTPEPAPTPKAFLGRADITTWEQAENWARRSQAEGVRLAKLAKDQIAAMATQKTDFEAKLASLSKELELARQTPAFRELPKEDVEKMRTANPADYFDYMQAKKAHDDGIAQAKAAADKSVREAAQKKQEGKAQAMAKYEAMSKDPKAYPKFAELEAAIDARWSALDAEWKSLLETSPYGPEALYLMEMGSTYLALQQKGVEEQAKAAEEAKKKAEAAAKGTQSPQPGSTKPPTAAPKPGQPMTDEQWRAWRRSAVKEHPGVRIFKTRT